MAGSKRVEPGLGSMGVLDGDEKLPGVDDPAGTPTDAQTTPAALSAYLSGDFLRLDASNGPVTGILVVDSGAGQVVVDSDEGGAGGSAAITLRNETNSQVWGLRSRDISDIFQIKDETGGSTPFKIEAGGPVNLLYLGSGGFVGINTNAPAVQLDVAGNVRIQSNNELRFADNGNYVGFEAPPLSADQIWVLPDADAPNNGDVWCSDAAGNLDWRPGTKLIETGFSSPSGSSGTFYERGHYRFGASDDDFNPSITFGTANAAYGDHVFVVAAAGGGGGTDTVVRVTGTSITDAQVRTAADTEDLTLDDAGAAGAYYETAKKWNGQVTIAKISGPDLLCNYGRAKYFDYGNRDYTIKGLDCTWRGGANDASADIRLCHHKSTGWTYNAGSTPTPPTAIGSQVATNAPESETRNGEDHAWKIVDLDTAINGSASEGFIIELFTTSNKTFDTGSNISIEILPAVSV